LDAQLFSFAESHRSQLPGPDEGTPERVQRWREESKRWQEEKSKKELAQSKDKGRSEADKFLAAVRRGDLVTVQDLLDRDPSLTGARKARTEETALHIAATYGWTEIVRLLIDRGASLGAEAIDRYTPLTAARRSVSRGGTGADEQTQEKIVSMIKKAGGV
jgi:hypothetical protein